VDLLASSLEAIRHRVAAITERPRGVYELPDARIGEDRLGMVSGPQKQELLLLVVSPNAWVPLDDRACYIKGILHRTAGLHAQTKQQACDALHGRPHSAAQHMLTSNEV